MRTKRDKDPNRRAGACSRRKRIGLEQGTIGMILLRTSNKQISRSNRTYGTNEKRKVFAYGEDTHALRLTSELADLRAGYVNLQPFALLRANFKSIYHKQQNRPALRTGLFCWQG